VGLLIITALAAGELSLAPAFTRVATQGLPGDADGDGVPDAEDCAPNDARLSALHTYYFDEDGDQFGRPTDPISLCTLVPPPGLVAWGSDQNDRDNKITAPIAQKGDRVLGVDFSEP